jgi:pimeloyl-ACP methyl ester carboxylesterase
VGCDGAGEAWRHAADGAAPASPGVTRGWDQGAHPILLNRWPERWADRRVGRPVRARRHAAARWLANRRVGARNGCVADICAPSWAVRSYRDIAYLNTWIAHGFAIVSTDYAGLGTPGGHPYLNVRSGAYSVLDSVRAALAHDSKLANTVVLVGQSQGGGAAFGTAAYAPQYAADINLRGTVATGVTYFGPNAPSGSAPDPTRVDPAIAYIFYIVLMAQQTDRSLDAATLFTPAALPLFEVARAACIDPLEDDIKLAELSDAKALIPPLRAVFAEHIADCEDPTVALKSPVFIGTGTADTDVLPAVQRKLVKDSCAAGTIVEAHEYAGLTHSQTVNASLKDSLPFVQKLLARQRITPVCSPVPE